VDECNGRIALVTGASRGIGAAIAVRLAAAGASVAITARTMHEEPGASVAGSLQSTVAAVVAVGGTAYPVVADLTDPDSRARVVPAVEAALGPIDVLVNNAAIAWYGNVEDLTRRRARLLMELDYHAPVELTQAALPAMRERRTGWIVNVSSVLARHPEPAPFTHVLPMTRIGWHYGAVKAALERFTTGLATEVYGDRIAVNALLPAAGVRTAAFEAISARVTPRPGLLEPVEQMAEAALALATGDPAVLTGRIVTSGDLLAELDRAVHTLDGSSTLDVEDT
jgi:NAD(P)-dependent dehydrogenase (short-subunit alcohol dehydrogenase family)